MVFNATFNNISVIYCGSQFYWWRKPEDLEKTTDLSQATDKLYHIILYTSPWSRFKLTINESYLKIQQKWCQNSGQRYHGNIHCTYYTTEMMSKLWSMIPWKYTLYLLYNRNDVKTLVNDTMEIYIVLIIQQKWCQNSGQWYHGNIHCTYYTTEIMSKLWSMIPWKYTLYLLYNRNDVKTLVNDVKTLVNDTMDIYIVYMYNVCNLWVTNSFFYQI
jgi:hypothetical protein